MCLAPRDDTNVAYDSKRVVQQQQPPAAATATAIAQDDDDDDDLCPRVTFDPSHNKVHVIPTALSCLAASMAAASTSDDDDDAVATTAPARASLAERRRHLWYNRDDIQEFRRQAQTISQRLRDNLVSSSSCDDDDSDDESDDDDEKDQEEDDDDDDLCPRGLEVRMSLQRQDRRIQIVRLILQAQEDQCATAEELALISKEHSVWSCKLAQAQGRKDYYAAYHPHLMGTISNNSSRDALLLSPLRQPPPRDLLQPPSLWNRHQSLDCHRDLVRNKRSLLGTPLEQQTGRRVRCRMY